MIMLAFVAATALTPGPLSEEEIVVIGKRLERVQVNVTRDPQGRLHCSLNGSSGNARLDERVCKASAKCVRRIGGQGDAAVHRCIVEGKASLLAKFQKEWRRSRAQ